MVAIAVGTAALWLVAVLLSASSLRSYLPLFYAIQLALYCSSQFSIGKLNALQVLRPSFVMLCYLGTGCVLGSAAFSSGAVLQSHWHASYSAWANTHQLYFLVSASFLLCFLTTTSYESGLELLQGKRLTPSKSDANMIGVVAVLGAVLAIALLFESPYRHITIGSIAVAIIYFLFRCGFRFRGSAVVLLVLAIATTSAHDKRTAVFTLLPAALMQATFYGNVKIRPKLVLALMGLAGLVGYLIAAMSIVRGYGGYGDVSLTQALALVPDYLVSDIALAALSNNFETSYVFYTLHDAVYTSSVAHLSTLELGQTYLKVFFIGIPDWVFDYKPTSIIDSYTRHSAPIFRAEGGSFPPTAIGEIFWNFGQYGVLLVPVLCAGMDWLYFKIARTLVGKGFFRSAIALFAYQYILVFIRGSGLDLYTASVVLAVPHIFVLALFISPLAFSSRKSVRSTESLKPGPW